MKMILCTGRATKMSTHDTHIHISGGKCAYTVINACPALFLNSTTRKTRALYKLCANIKELGGMLNTQTL
jgi:hypothetical protein